MADEPTDASVDDMLMLDNEAVGERVASLEKKVQEQSDEIVCLRSTLAEVVRRLATLENARAPIANNVSVTAPSWPRKDSSSLAPRKTIPASATTNYYNSQQQQPQQQQQQLTRQRSAVSQSSGSLHSDGLSSSSASPVPSPSPSHSQQSTHSSSNPSPRHTPALSPNRNLVTFNNTRSSYDGSTDANSTNAMMKKWASSLDFNGGSPNSGLQRRMYSPSSGSMINLHARQSQAHIKHGTKDAVYNAEEGCLRLFLRGRPIILFAPTSLMPDYSLTKVNELPLERLKLDWVYGYRGRDCRSNLYFLPTGEMVYFIAAVVVLFNVEDQMQRHYLGHTDDIKCLAIHPNKFVIATGQTSGHFKRDIRPHVRIWDSVSLNTLQVLGFGEFDRSVACLAFSKLDGGHLLCVVDEAPEHNMTVWEWHKGDGGQKIMETKSSTEPVLAVDFHPMDRHVLVSCGKSHVSFWAMEGSLSKQLGIFDKRSRPKFVLCLAFSDTGDVLTGDSSGHILIWQRGANRVGRVINNAHEGGVFSICPLKDGRYITGGGRDGRIREWDNHFSPTGNDVELSQSVGSVRTLTQGKGNFILVGTTKNCIVEGTLDLGFHVVMQGHTEELWGLAVHPSQNQFVTAGMDRRVHLWDTMSHSVVWSTEVTDPAKSACFSPDGSVVVVATASGRWYVFDAATRETYASYVDGNEAIDVAKFSPDGHYLALGSRDNHIYVYQVSNEMRQYNRISRCSVRVPMPGHSSFITHLDWSSTNHIIQSNSADLEILYWNAPVCRQLTASSQMRDVEWHTQNCTLGFTVIGIWPEGADGTDVNACTRSHNKKLLASGDDWGKVKLFSYPVTHPKALCHIYGGHSSHVTRLDFLHDDTRLISLGGRDSSVMQWMIH